MLKVIRENTKETLIFIHSTTALGHKGDFFSSYVSSFPLFFVFSFFFFHFLLLSSPFRFPVSFERNKKKSQNKPKGNTQKRGKREQIRFSLFLLGTQRAIEDEIGGISSFMDKGSEDQLMKNLETIAANWHLKN